MTLVLDAGALIEAEGGGERTLALIHGRPAGAQVVVPASVLAQVWRGGPQARLSRLLRGDVQVAALDEAAARAVGALLRASGTRDIADAQVVLVARQHKAAIVTSDPDDLRALDPKAKLHTL